MWANIQIKKKRIKNKITNRYGRIIQIHTPTERQACPREGCRVARADGQRETESERKRERRRANERERHRARERVRERGGRVGKKKDRLHH